MRYQDINTQAWTGTAEELVQLLETHRDDPRAVTYIEKGVRGLQNVYNNDGFWCGGFDAVRDQERKFEIMAGFYTERLAATPQDDLTKTVSGIFNTLTTRDRAAKPVFIADPSSKGGLRIPTL